MSDSPDLPESYEPTRQCGGRFGPGNPGRRIGARAKASHKVVMAILEDFQFHRHEVLKNIRASDAQAYLATVMRLLPAMDELETEPAEPLTLDQAAKVARRVRQTLGQGEEPRIALQKVGVILEGAPEDSPPY